MHRIQWVAAGIVVALAIGAPSAVNAEDVECRPTAVGEDYSEKFILNGSEVGAVAVQCEETPGVIYYVARTDGQAAARFTSLALAALLSGKRLRLSFNSPTNTCKPGLVCYWLHQWSISR